MICYKIIIIWIWLQRFRYLGCLPNQKKIHKSKDLGPAPFEILQICSFSKTTLAIQFSFKSFGHNPERVMSCCRRQGCYILGTYRSKVVGTSSLGPIRWS